MYPILLSIGNFSVSSFGLFLILGLLVASFYIWRVIRVYDFDEEKTIDLILWVGVFTLIISRLYYIALNPTHFNVFFKIVLLNRYTGLSFWGGLIGAFIALRFFAARLKVNFWQVADYAMMGGFMVMAFGSIGCLLGSCSYGLVANNWMGVTQVGVLGKRFPIQIFDFLFSIIVFWYLFRKILRFHFNGQIFAIGLILLGLERLFTQPFRGFSQSLFLDIHDGYLWGTLILIYGILIYYRQSKKSFRADLNFIVRNFTQSNTREKTLTRISRSWFNLVVRSRLALAKYKRLFVKYLNVKNNPKEF